MAKIKYPYEYDPKKRKLAKVYMRIKLMAGVVNGMVVPIIFLLAFFYLGFSSALLGLIGNNFFTVPIFIIVLLLMLEIIEFPLRFYSSYVYEHKYKLSKHTKASWFKDYIKQTVVGFIFSVPVLAVVYFLMGFSYWWIYAAILFFFLSVFMDTIYPVLILPFFYKLKPFENKKLKKRLLEMAKKAGSKNIEDVLIAKESDKSVKANAMFTGMGKTKKIILFDTLLNNFTEAEVESVIGHELGHYVHKHITKGIVLETVLLLPTFFIIHYVLSIMGILGNIVSLPIYLVTFQLIGLVLMPFENSVSRRWETNADWFGLEQARNPVAQISTEKRLADQALSDIDPNPFVEWLLFSHPNATKRIAMVKKWEKQNPRK